MAKKPSLITLLLNIFSGKMTQEDKKDAEEFIENKLGDDYEEYLQKPKEHHDKVIKRMYRNTKHADESPNRLREILREQVIGHSSLLH